MSMTGPQRKVLEHIHEWNSRPHTAYGVPEDNFHHSCAAALLRRRWVKRMGIHLTLTEAGVKALSLQPEKLMMTKTNHLGFTVRALDNHRWETHLGGKRYVGTWSGITGEIQNYLLKDEAQAEGRTRLADKLRCLRRHCFVPCNAHHEGCMEPDKEGTPEDERSCWVRWESIEELLS